MYPSLYRAVTIKRLKKEVLENATSLDGVILFRDLRKREGTGPRNINLVGEHHGEQHSKYGKSYVDVYRQSIHDFTERVDLFIEMSSTGHLDQGKSHIAQLRREFQNSKPSNLTVHWTDPTPLDYDSSLENDFDKEVYRFYNEKVEALHIMETQFPTLMRMAHENKFEEIVFQNKIIQQAIAASVVEYNALRKHIESCLQTYLKSDIFTTVEKIFKTLRFTVDVYTYLKVFEKGIGDNVIFHCGANHARRIYLLIMGTPNVSYYTNFGRYSETPPLQLGFYRLFQKAYEEPSMDQVRETVKAGIRKMSDIEYLTRVVAPDEKFIFETPAEEVELMQNIDSEKKSLEEVEDKILEIQASIESENSSSLVEDELASMKRRLVQLDLKKYQMQKSYYEDKIQKMEAFAKLRMKTKQQFAYATHLMKMKELFVLHVVINEFPHNRITRDLIGSILSVSFEDKSKFNAENLAFMTPSGLHKLVRNFTDVLSILEPKGLTVVGNTLSGLKKIGFGDSDLHALLNAKSYNLDEREKDTIGKISKILKQTMGLV